MYEDITDTNFTVLCKNIFFSYPRTLSNPERINRT